MIPLSERIPELSLDFRDVDHEDSLLPSRRHRFRYGVRETSTFVDDRRSLANHRDRYTVSDSETGETGDGETGDGENYDGETYDSDGSGRETPADRNERFRRALIRISDEREISEFAAAVILSSRS